jgi:dTDP-4-dehydrorhamnose 3,5-epimerase
MAELTVNQSLSIPGLFKISLVINTDARGSFTELYQTEKLQNLGLPKLNIVQTNLSVNHQKGILRGIHAEPWNKFITPLRGKVFVAIVDLRPTNFGKLDTLELEFGQAILVPKGCANSYQTLTDEVLYLYQVDAHWQPGQNYPAINCFDKELAIAWPIAQNKAILSDKDKANPALAELRQDLGIRM